MSNKVFVIGIDGMDPKMTRRMVDEGKLPHIKKLIEMGSARQDLKILGAMPTITPPMWTTMATGAYPMTHGITCYWNSHPTDLGKFEYAFDSNVCLAEQIWNCTAEAGKKTLVWTWPGASWPPSSDSENLHVVGGVNPSGPNACSDVVLDDEHITYASIENGNVSPRVVKELRGGAGCTLDGDLEDSGDDDNYASRLRVGNLEAVLLLDHMEGEELNETPLVIPSFNSPIKQPANWKHELPEGALEFPVIIQSGMKQLPALLLKNEDGKYDTVAVYLSKKDAEPWARVTDGQYLPLEMMEFTVDGQKVHGTRSVSILKIDPEGKSVILSMGKCYAVDTPAAEMLWSPRSLYKQTVDIAGYVPSTIILGGGYPEMVSRRCLPSWDYFEKWQAQALLGLIEENDYEAVFTHMHSCDHIGHVCWRWAKHREAYGSDHDETVYQGFLEEIYLQADDYVSRLMPLMDKGWTLILTSDHGLLCSEEDELPFLGEGFVMNVGVLKELGYTVFKKDENGNEIREIDWEKTRAVAPRGNHIYINLKGRNDHGCVDPADKYDLERQIIDDLYNYRMHGKRVVNIAMRNKDAVLLGMSGERCGDIIYFLEEGFNRLHGDALPTTEGYFGTSVSPIFVAAGPGVKSGYTMERMIRQVDLAPTVAAIMGVRLPAQAEGAVVHQILPDTAE